MNKKIKIDEKKKTVKKVVVNKNNKKKVVKKNTNEIKNSFTTIEVVSLVIMTCIVSLIIGAVVSYNLNNNKMIDNDKNLQEFVNNYQYIVDNYYEDVDKKQLLDHALKGMLDSLDDDYSYLIDETDSDSFNIQLEGEYNGVGIEIVSVETGEIYIYRVFEGSPADKAGLKSGDIIKEIDGKDFSSSQTNEIAKYIKENKNDSFKVKVQRDNNEKTFVVKKESVVIKSVDSKIIKKENKKIGYIYIDIFSNVAYKQFKKELEELETKKIDSLIIDVRNNTGGHLTTATNIISLFLNSKHIIYQTETKKEIKKFYSTGKVDKKYPIVVLQNSDSASASEMLSAALKEEYGATIVGELSYGKGTVQELMDVSSGSEYKITTKKWLTPKGNWINKKGVSVDVEVSLNEDYEKNPSDENDNQLQTAIKQLIK